MAQETSPRPLQEEYLKRQYKIRELITPIVNAADTEGLLKLGSPTDEYAGEIKQISEHLCREQGIYGTIQLSIDQISCIVANVFCLSFGSWTQFPKMSAKYSKLGENIWRVLYKTEK